MLPPGVDQVISGDEAMKVKLPDDAAEPQPERSHGRLRYKFPKKCTLPRDPVGRYSLAAVIGLAVACICLWGTLIGSMLPLVFRRLGVDPGIASSPFVATFVDVTGIVIYFMISRVILGI